VFFLMNSRCSLTVLDRAFICLNCDYPPSWAGSVCVEIETGEGSNGW